MTLIEGFKRNPNVVWRRETRGGCDEGLLLFNYGTRDIHFLKGISALLWEALESRSLEDVLKKHGLEGDSIEVNSFLKGLMDRGLLSDGHGPADPKKGIAGSGGMWGKRVYFDAPLFVQFDCTNRCNLRCRHCVTEGGEEIGDELSTREALELIRELGDQGVFQIGFSGGEPLMRKDIFLLMEEVRRRGMRLQLTTNATLIDDDLAERIAKLGPITVGVSLEGATRESYEAVRGTGSYERFLKGVNALVKAGAPVKFKTAVFKDNLMEIEGIMELALLLGVKAVDMFLFYPAGRGVEMKGQMLSTHGVRDFLTGLAHLQKRYKGVLEVDVDDKPNAFLVDTQLSHSTCGAGAYWAEVLPNGDVVPCIFFKDTLAGNVRRASFKSSWDSKVWDPFRNRTELKGRCGTCEHRLRCGGGCRANGYSSTGDYLSEDTLCWYKVSE